MIKASYYKHTLLFKRPGGTSRGVLKKKDSYFIKLWDEAQADVIAWGECSHIKGLSPDAIPDFEEKLHSICENIHQLESNYWQSLIEWPSIIFGLEMAFYDLKNKGKRILFSSDFTEKQAAIPINGLIWMGSPDFMEEQIIQKQKQGFNCIKMKIGAIDFEEEYAILKNLRKNFDGQIRVDANGGFAPNKALELLKRLADLGIHSIEQPIMAGQAKKMYQLCRETPLPIALDEELIGMKNKAQLLEDIQAQYIILKPSLLGGFQHSEEWIALAEERDIKWWVTSALEANVGLNAIAQWTYTLLDKPNRIMPQGLGTGKLFSNNIESPLFIDNGQLFYDKNGLWGRMER